MCVVCTSARGVMSSGTFKTSMHSINCGKCCSCIGRRDPASHDVRRVIWLTAPEDTRNFPVLARCAEDIGESLVHYVQVPRAVVEDPLRRQPIVAVRMLCAASWKRVGDEVLGCLIGQIKRRRSRFT